MPCPTNSDARSLTPLEQIGGLQRSLFNALADAERLREALAVVDELRVMPLRSPTGWTAFKVGELGRISPTYPDAVSALLAAKAEIEGRK